MDFKIIWTEGAVADLGEIIAYIGKRNPKAAQRLGEAILEHVELLGNFPYIGPQLREPPGTDVREIVYDNYRIFYQVEASPKTVFIVGVHHGARQNPEYL